MKDSQLRQFWGDKTVSVLAKTRDDTISVARENKFLSEY